MAILLNSRQAKCMKRILSIAKYISTNKRGTAVPDSIQSVLASMIYSPSNRTNAAKSMVFGFSLLEFIGLDESKINRQLIDTIKRGLFYLENDGYNAFEQTLQEALKMAYDLKSFDGITYVYDLLANGAFMNKEYEKAEAMFNQVVNQLTEQGSRKNELYILYVGLKISKIYEVQKNYKKSEFGYIYCVQNLEKKIKIDPENRDVLRLYGITLDAYGRYLMSQGEIKMARICFKKAYKTSVKLNGEVFEMNAILLNDLGTLYYVQGNHIQAFYYFRKAEQIGKHFPDIEVLSMVYINLGNIYLKQGMLKEAEKNCMEGLKNAKRHRYAKGKKAAKMCLAKIKNAKK